MTTTNTASAAEIVNLTEQIRASCRRAADHCGAGRMPLGKFKGAPIANMQPRYLRWLLKNVPLDDDLRKLISRDLAERKRTKTV